MTGFGGSFWRKTLRGLLKGFTLKMPFLIKKLILVGFLNKYLRKRFGSV
jgi:hypothetical protein